MVYKTKSDHFCSSEKSELSDNNPTKKSGISLNPLKLNPFGKKDVASGRAHTELD